jgi:hypothetical protein
MMVTPRPMRDSTQPTVEAMLSAIACLPVAGVEDWCVMNVGMHERGSAPSLKE